MFLDLIFIFTIIVITSTIIAIIITIYSKCFSHNSNNDWNLSKQKEWREILDKYKTNIGIGNISFMIDTKNDKVEEYYTSIDMYLPLYCKIYNINDDILNKIDPYGYKIFEKKDLLRFIEFFALILNEQKNDEEKEKILDKALGRFGYDKISFINDIQNLKTLFEKAIKENKNIIQQGD